MTPSLPPIETITGTPIVNDPALKNFGGKFVAPTIVDKILSYLPLLNHSNKGSIHVNPANVNDVGAAVNHEAVHSLLNELNQSGKLDELNKANPSYAALAAKFPSFTGEPNQEVPAYAASGETNSLNIPQGMVSPYTNTLIEQLMKLDPSLAGKYKALAGVK